MDRRAGHSVLAAVMPCCAVAPMIKVLGAVVLFFGNVNQVLVRLWARAISGQLSVVSGQTAV